MQQKGSFCLSAAFAADGIGQEGGDGSAQHGRNVIYDCLVFLKLILDD